MKKGLKYLSLGLTCIRILGGDGTAIAELPKKVFSIYADTDYADIADNFPV